MRGPGRHGKRIASMTGDSTWIAQSLVASFDAAEEHATPYRHWLATRCMPADVADEITALPFPAPELGGISGKRELHNATRKYFDRESQARHPAVAAFADAFQSRAVTDVVESRFGTRLGGSYLRIEFAQDIDGFWLEPHTDLGVKVFTMLIYLSRDPEHRELGTDIYDRDKRHVGRSPFVPNGAMIFVPSTDTFHGFEPRPIHGVRKSLIVNYVTEEWRAREQLSFPDRPIAA
jgi:hypothetical protein